MERAAALQSDLRKELELRKTHERQSDAQIQRLEQDYVLASRQRAEMQELLTQNDVKVTQCAPL